MYQNWLAIITVIGYFALQHFRNNYPLFYWKHGFMGAFNKWFKFQFNKTAISKLKQLIFLLNDDIYCLKDTKL
jgi:hypothetical protein